MAKVRRVIYATSKKEALEEFARWKDRYEDLVPKAIACLEKDLDETLRFFDFPYRIWASIRTTNIIRAGLQGVSSPNQSDGYIPHGGILYPHYVLLSSDD